MMDKIELKNMSFFGYHGLIAEEKKIGQRFYVDLAIWLDLANAGKSDDIADTIDYNLVYKTVKEIVEGQKVNLIEHLASKINENVLHRFSLISKVTTTVRKPSAPVAGVLDYVSVTLREARKK